MFRWECLPDFVPASDFPFESIAFLWPLFTPEIVTLEVQLNDSDDPKYRLFLENYPSLCPNLKSIKFNFSSGIQDHETVSQPEALSQAICGNANWQHVELSPSIDNVVLKHLGICSALETVSLTVAPQMSRPDEACSGPEDTPFRSVTDLALILWNSLDFATCLLRPRDQVFNSFKVTLYTLMVATELSSLLAALASPQRTNSLRSINISHVHHIVSGASLSTIDTHRSPLSYETFRPLVSLANLRRLVINLNHSTSLNDEEFAGLVRNWPLLENLHMTWACVERPLASITLKGLLSLIGSCPRLRQVALTLDASDVPVVGTYADVCNPSITSPIQFHNSPLKDPDLVAKFLMKHLPSIPGVVPTFTWVVTWHTAQQTTNIADFSLEYRRLWLQVNGCIGHPTFT